MDGGVKDAGNAVAAEKEKLREVFRRVLPLCW
jgi:hypothetical protein